MTLRWTIWTVPARGSAFDACAEEYDRARPRYPRALGLELLRRLRLRRGNRVLDVGAGTGISTTFLRGLGLRVTPLEPGLAMLRQGRLRAVCGRAEALPFRTGAFDAAISIQAFHWTDPKRSLPECARVAPRLAMFWVQRETHPVWDDLHALVRRHNPAYGRRRESMDARWRRLLGPRARFSEHRFAQPFDEERFVLYALSLSYLRSRVPARRLPRLRKELREIWRRHGGGRRSLPFRAELWTRRA